MVTLFGPHQVIAGRELAPREFVESWAGAAAMNALRDASATCGYNARRLAKHFGVTQRQLQRVFLAHLSCTPQVWLREERMQRAIRMLHVASTVKEVAYSLGYSRDSQFCRDFKRRFGHAPSVELKPKPMRIVQLLRNARR